MAVEFLSNRRRFLQGAGACLALPVLKSLGAAAAVADVAPLAVSPTGIPLRTAFLTIPDGVILDCWRPKGVGREYGLNRTFAPLAPLQEKFQIFTGFAHKNARALGDGGGDHARASAAFLTGAHPVKTGGADFRNGISIDQVAARQIGNLTRIPSLQLGCDLGRMTGTCDTGYSCAYQFNISWATPTLPMAPETNPRAVFERLFGSGPPAKRQQNLLQRQARRRSILDVVLADAKAMRPHLGGNDRHKLDEYLTSVRSIEKQIEQAERFPLPAPTMKAPSGIPQDYQTHLRLMFDLLAVAFQTDSTRLATFPLAYEGSNRSFPELGINEGHHTLSHHQNDQKKIDKLAQIDRFYMEQFAYFLDRLEAIREADGSTLLDNSMIVYGCAISDGNRHAHLDLPIVLAGGGGGSLTPGRHVDLGREVPMTNLYLAMLDRLGIQAERFGDSTGRLADI